MTFDWLCECGHHQLHHWWHTGKDPDGKDPDTVFGTCVDAGPCECTKFVGGADDPSFVATTS